MTRPIQRRGSAMIEFLLGLAVLLPVVVGLFQYAVTANVLSDMQVVLREGAEFASRQPVPHTGEGDRELQRKVANVVVFGKPEGGLAPEELTQLATWTPIGLGPRILRAETAPVVAVTIIRALTKT